RQRDEHRRRYPHPVLPFLFAATYHLATYIATLCTDAYLKSTGRFSLQGQIVRHRCTKTVPRLALLDANALLMPFQFQVHLDAELRRVLGDVDVAVPTPVLGELGMLVGLSQQSAAQRILELIREGLVARDLATRRQRIRLTPRGGEVIRKEYADYQRIFEIKETVTISGAVASGLREGAFYMRQKGYKDQFRKKLWFEP